MKVSEARLKVCPFIQDIKDYKFSHINGCRPRNIHCICGECMAWVYTKIYMSDEIIEHRTHVSGSKFKIEHKRPELWIDDKEGYCSRLHNES